jgi:hypothetical protein
VEVLGLRSRARRRADAEERDRSLLGRGRRATGEPPLTPAQLELVHIVAQQTLSPGEALTVDLPGHGVITFRRPG